jgi:tripartite-type tricarboxylate transporter receptor subunit TctC
MHPMRLAALALALLHPALAAPPAAAAEPDFYAGKTIVMAIGSDVGGAFDLYARTLTQFLPRHIPGHPQFTSENRVGAGGRVAANWLYNVAPRDGTVIGQVGPWIAMEPMWRIPGVQFDAVKFNWLGNANREVSSCAFWTRTPFGNFSSLQTGATQPIVGAPGTGTAMSTDVLALNALVGAKMKLVQGYKGSREVIVAGEAGELDGACGLWASAMQTVFAEYVKRGQLKVVVQMGLESHPVFGDAPNVVLAARNPDDRLAMELVFGQLQMARPFLFPPGVPAERVALMRKAFDDTFADPEFQAAARARTLEVRPLSGDAIQTLMARLYATPQPVIERVKTVLGY